MHHNFCTLFDSGYLTRGWVLFESLAKVCNSFHLYIFAFDELSSSLLKEEKPDHVTVISLVDFETKRLLEIKEERTRGEYCWTCASQTIRFLFDTYKLDEVTYLDADLFFFNSPEPLFEEMGDSSVLITSHRFLPGDPRIESRGEFCVQFMVFKNNEEGRKVLDWWADSCLDWCYARVEDGKFGDQKYLDQFSGISSKVKVLAHLGGGLAPWNAEYFQYKPGSPLEVISNNKKKTGESFPVIFFHFHDLKIIGGKRAFYLGNGYFIPKKVRTMLYRPYVSKLRDSEIKWGNKMGRKEEFPIEKEWKTINRDYFLGRNIFFDKNGSMKQKRFFINTLYSYLIAIVKIILPKRIKKSLRRNISH